MKKILISLGFAALALGATAQVKIKDGTITGSSTTPNSNAILELESNNKGLLYPRVALTNTTTALSGGAMVAGMTVYNTANAGSGSTAVTPGVYYNDGTQWVRVLNGSNFQYGAGSPISGATPAPTATLNSIYADTGFTSATLGNMWIYTSTGWQTYTQPPSTEWYIAGTASDAGASKAGFLSHNGYISVYTGPNPTTSAANPAVGVNVISDNGAPVAGEYEADVYNTGATSAPVVYLDMSRGTVASPVNLVNGDLVGAYRFRGCIGGAIKTGLGQILNIYTGNGSTTSNSIRVQTNDFSPTGGGGATLGTSSLPWGQIYSTSGTIQSSDIRLKKDIEPLTYGLNQIMQIEPISYNLKSGSNGATRLWGVSAQQIQNILPDVVNVGDDENKTLGVRYDELIPVLINAVKELKAENNAMQQQIEALKAGK